MLVSAMVGLILVRNGQRGLMMGVAFDLPATYKIRVNSYLDESRSERLGGMAIEVAGQAY